MSILLAAGMILAFSSLQVAVVSRLPLQNGMADLVLLFVIAWSLNREAKQFYIPVLLAAGLMTFISSVPIPAVLLSYAFAALITRLLVSRLWEMPVFSMLILTLIATITQHVIYIVIMQIGGTPISLGESLNLVTLPSAFLNIILSLPIFLIVRDVQKIVFTEVAYE